MRHLLLVEDDYLIALSEMHSLESLDFRVSHAASGRQALESVRNNEGKFDLILMDVELGEPPDGVQVAAEILRDSPIPIVFLTSHDESTLIERARGIASYSYIKKGSTLSKMAATILGAIARHEELRTSAEGGEHSRSLTCDSEARLDERVSPQADVHDRNTEYG